MANMPFLVFLLNSCQRRVQHWIEAQSPESERLSAAQAGVLFVLEKQDGILLGEVASQLDIVPSAISGLIDRMQKQQLVHRQKCPQDGRAIRLWLTTQGRARLLPIKNQLATLNRKLGQGFTPDELGIVERWLKHIHQEFQG
ncbi:MarR family winged helix-turn-helix transcriptional regulator [Alkanindiges sp. WGS2144]|uniref:MarR family winged helix-turn-helix transcriptional regulator n=1 Tax=Alkanindiges sp. WGS2144 TaxID=3366808 RepID=UPI0037524D6D